MDKEKQELKIQQEEFIASILSVLEFSESDNDSFEEDKVRFTKEFDKALRRSLGNYINHIVDRRLNIFWIDRKEKEDFRIEQERIRLEEEPLEIGKKYHFYIPGNVNLNDLIITDIRHKGKAYYTATPLPLYSTYSRYQYTDQGNKIQAATQNVDVENAVFFAIINLVIEVFNKKLNGSFSLRDFLRGKNTLKNVIGKISELDGRKLSPFFLRSKYFNRERCSMKNELEIDVRVSTAI